MEGSGTVGIMEARQDRRGGEWCGEERRGMGGKGNAGRV